MIGATIKRILILFVCILSLREGAIYKGGGRLNAKSHHHSSTNLPFPTHYTPLGVIGKGRQGVVYKAVHIANPTAKPVAIKIIPLRNAEDSIQAQRTINILSNINHPNVVKLVEADFITNNSPVGVMWLAMELVEGKTLAQYLQDGQHAKVHDGIEEYRRMARQLLSTLHHLHHEAIHPKGIIYGDLNSENIMINDNSPKLVDFGHAHLGDSGSEICKYWDYSATCCILAQLNTFIGETYPSMEHQGDYADFVEKIRLGSEGNLYDFINHPFIKET